MPAVTKSEYLFLTLLKKLSTIGSASFVTSGIPFLIPFAKLEINVFPAFNAFESAPLKALMKVSTLVLLIVLSWVLNLAIPE